MSRIARENLRDLDKFLSQQDAEREHQRLCDAVVEASQQLIAASEKLDEGWNEFTGGNMEVVDRPLDIHTEKYEALQTAVYALNAFEAAHKSTDEAQP